MDGQITGGAPASTESSSHSGGARAVVDVQMEEAGEQQASQPFEGMQFRTRGFWGDAYVPSDEPGSFENLVKWIKNLVVKIFHDHPDKTKDCMLTLVPYEFEFALVLSLH